MSDVIDWSKAPEGATQYVINSAGPWEKIEDGKLYYWYKGDWLKLPWRGDDSCSERKIVKRPQPAPWSGEGLPPVGAVCEYRVNDGPWYKCEIRYIVKAEGEAVIAYCQHLEMDQILYEPICTFRQIRAAEQIAAEERELFARTLTFEMWKDPLDAPNAMNQARKMYDLGYRKQ